MKKIILFSLIIILFSCDNQKIKIITISSNLPQIEPLIQEFNNKNKDIKIILKTMISEKDSDIIIFKGQQDRSPFETINLNEILNKNLNPDMFYTDIIKQLTNKDGSINLLPLSFDLPGFIYNNKNTFNSQTIDITNFLENNKTKFSPFWESDFVMWYFLSGIPDFNNQNYFDKNEFIDSAKTINNYIDDRAEKWDVHEFNAKYLYLSPELLIRSSLIDYYYYTISNYIKLSDDQKKDLSFSTISRNDILMTLDTMTYVGINKSSNNKNNSKKILLWIFNSYNQSNYIKNNIENGGLFPLFCGELSTLKDVTQTTLPLYYPVLKKIIPKTETITSPINLPNLWESLKNSVFIPMFKDSKTLPIQEWNNKYSDYYSDWAKKNNK